MFTYNPNFQIEPIAPNVQRGATLANVEQKQQKFNFTNEVRRQDSEKHRTGGTPSFSNLINKSDSGLVSTNSNLLSGAPTLQKPEVTTSKLKPNSLAGINKL